MADMEGNTGKDLALEKLKNFEDKVKNSIKEKKNKEEGVILLENSVKTENNLGIELKYKQVKGKYIFSLGDKEIFTMDEKGIFTYNTENINAINKDKNNSIKNLEDSIGLPKIAEIERIKEEKQNEQKEQGSEEKAPEDKGTEEKADKEKPELNKEEQEKDAKQQVAKRNGVSASKIIEIDLYRSISEHEGGLINQLPKLREQVKKEGKTGRVFIVEKGDKDAYEYDLLMEDAKTGEIIDLNEKQKALKRVEGTNPSHEKIVLTDQNKKMSEVTARAIYMEDNRVGIAIAYDEHGRLQPMQIRRLDNDQYTATPIKTKGIGNTDISFDEESTHLIDRTQGNDDEVKEKIERFYQAKNDKELPHDANPAKDEDGIHMDEVKTAADLKEARIKAIEEELKSKDGVDFPGKAKEIATKMVEKMYDSNGEPTGVSYDDAKQQAMESGKEQGGRTQGEERKDPRIG